MHAGNYEHIELFEQLIQHIFRLIEENIKLYAEREENERLKILEAIIQEFFQRHLFEYLDDEIIHEIKKDFEIIIRSTLADLMKEKKIERRLRHGRKPANAYFRELFYENKQLNRKQLSDARELLELHKDEQVTKEQLEKIIQALTRIKAPDTAPGRQHEERLRQAFSHFITIIAQEFHALYDIDVDAALQEADLLHELNWLLKQKNVTREHKKRIKAIKKNVHQYFTKDLRAFKRMIREGKAEKKEVKEIREEKKPSTPSAKEQLAFDNKIQHARESVDKIGDLITQAGERKLNPANSNITKKKDYVEAEIILSNGETSAGSNFIQSNRENPGLRSFHAEEEAILTLMSRGQFEFKNAWLIATKIPCLQTIFLERIEGERYNIVSNKSKRIIEEKELVYEKIGDELQLKVKTGAKPRYRVKQHGNFRILSEQMTPRHYLPKVLQVFQGNKVTHYEGCAVLIKMLQFSGVSIPEEKIIQTGISKEYYYGVHDFLSKSQVDSIQGFKAVTIAHIHEQEWKEAVLLIAKRLSKEKMKELESRLGLQQ